LVNELGADVNEVGEKNFSALGMAASLGQHDVVRYMVEELGADVNSPDKLGQTSLYLAASRGHLAVVRVLLKRGADIDRNNNEGVTPLMIAAFGKHQDVVKWLVKAGADIKVAVCHMSAADMSKRAGASAEQTAYLEAKTQCSHPGCSGAGIMKCTGCKQARYCGEACQLVHWKEHKADCRWWSAELAARMGK
jgi:hypothetical protein